MMINQFIKNQHSKEDFDTPQELLNKTTEKVTTFLNSYYPDNLNFGNGSFTISSGSTQVMIIIRPFTSTETCVELISNVVTGALINDELLRFLMHKNAELHFGSFGILFDGTITFSYSLTGSCLEENQFITALQAVSIISDHYDDIIVSIAGGKRASDDIDSLE
ncbi:MAG TPA: hypothetical protein PK762_03735 [Candidatus Kapabacteria bacterium]|nr:hypothetical protein [Candidatus Kapabacteria bacterium]